MLQSASFTVCSAWASAKATQGVAPLGQRTHRVRSFRQEWKFPISRFLSDPLPLIHIKLAQTSVYFTMVSTSVYPWFEIYIILFSF